MNDHFHVWWSFKTQKILADELNALQNEQDIPIEELLKLYGYNNAQNKEPAETAPKETVTKPESDHEESVEAESEVSPVQTNPNELQKGEKRSSSTPPPSKKARSELAKYFSILLWL